MTLFATVKVHDGIYPEATMPNTILLDYHQEQLSRCYKDSHQLWPEGTSRLALSQIVNQTYKQKKL